MFNILKCSKNLIFKFRNKSPYLKISGKYLESLRAYKLFLETGLKISCRVL